MQAPMLLLRYARQQQRRPFSSGIKPILRALADVTSEEDIYIGGKKAIQKQKQQQVEEDANSEDGNGSKKSKCEHNAGVSEVPAIVKAELERRTPKVRKGGAPDPGPVEAWKKTDSWACMKGCGACCFLDKGPQYSDVEEFLKDPQEVALHKSMIGKDGWCKHFNKRSKTCNIFEDRPRFCRVEPKNFKEYFGISEAKFGKEACSLCRDCISDVYGCKSKELKNFERLVQSLKNKS